MTGLYSAPNINTPITQGNGEITFGDANGSRSVNEIRKEAETLVAMLEAGSLPAAVSRPTDSLTTISPQFGKDNIDAGLHSSVIAILAVVGFMVVYYTITGLFADLALMMNLLLALATMSLSAGPHAAGHRRAGADAGHGGGRERADQRAHPRGGAPGGVPVDGGQAGLRQGFLDDFRRQHHHVLTSIVLIYVGSEEVKGFGVTLLIGLIVHMFTALFVTRTLMMGAIKLGVIRGWTTIDREYLERFGRSRGCARATGRSCG